MPWRSLPSSRQIARQVGAGVAAVNRSGAVNGRGAADEWALGQPASAAKQTAPVRSVSQVSADARFLVESNFRTVWIEGEISNFRSYASGHWYFSLKDDSAQLRCVMFATRNRFVRFPLADGLSVIVRGRLTIYEARGDFQAIVEHVQPAGEGALRAAFEQLKAKLAAEGLFAEDRKQPLPRFPRHIAIITSLDGAALRDVLAVVRRRFACLRITCFSVAVQGQEAAGQVLTAFDRAERMRHPPDVIVVTRGGGSLEDLATFNLESVARRIAAASIPVVAAIGHETDVTIADFVADQRASTPSAAAELVTPDGSELLQRLTALEGALVARLEATLHLRRQLLTAFERRLVHPQRALEQRLLRLDELAERLTAAARTAQQRRATALLHQAQLLARATPLRGIDTAGQRVRRAQQRLGNAATALQSRFRQQVLALARALNGVSPLATLERGFAIVAKPDGTRWGRPVTAAAQVTVGETLLAHLADGTVQAHVADTTPRGATDESATGGET